MIGRRDLQQVATIVKADTILAWYRKLIERSFSVPEKRPGRSRVRAEIRELVVSMALENSRWGYRRIQGELKAPGRRIARSTIADILRENGIEPPADRPTSWMTFIKAHWGCSAGSPAERTVTSNRQEGGGGIHGKHGLGDLGDGARRIAESRELHIWPHAQRANRSADVPLDLAVGLAANSPDRVQQVGSVYRLKERRTLERDRLLFDCPPRAA